MVGIKYAEIFRLKYSEECEKICHTAFRTLWSNAGRNILIFKGMASFILYCLLTLFRGIHLRIIRLGDLEDRMFTEQRVAAFVLSFEVFLRVPIVTEHSAPGLEHVNWDTRQNMPLWEMGHEN
jgi:hypothetical protein